MHKATTEITFPVNENEDSLVTIQLSASEVVSSANLLGELDFSLRDLGVELKNEKEFRPIMRFGIKVGELSFHAEKETLCAQQKGNQLRNVNNNKKRLYIDMTTIRSSNNSEWSHAEMLHSGEPFLKSSNSREETCADESMDRGKPKPKKANVAKWIVYFSQLVNPSLKPTLY